MLFNYPIQTLYQIKLYLVFWLGLGDPSLYQNPREFSVMCIYHLSGQTLVTFTVPSGSPSLHRYACSCTALKSTLDTIADW